MVLIAITGGIASGKSTVTARLAEHGAVVVDADALVRELQQPGGVVFDRIVAEFGAEMLTPAGTLDRAALGARVFADETQRQRLNDIVHPAVRRESTARFEAAAAADPDAVIVYDVPLLAEARTDGAWDVVVVVTAPEEIRVQRLIDHRGMTRDDAMARIRAQATDDQRDKLADVVIDTSATMADTLRQTDELWQRLTTRR